MASDGEQETRAVSYHALTPGGLPRPWRRTPGRRCAAGVGGEDGLLLRRKRQEPAHFFLRAGLFGREPANLGLSSAHSINCRIASALDASGWHVATRRCGREG